MEDFLRCKFVFLTEKLSDITNVTNHLFQKEILSQNEKETILNGSTSLEQNTKLLDILLRKDEVHLEGFLDTLEKTGNKHIAEEFRKYCQNGNQPSPSTGTGRAVEDNTLLNEVLKNVKTQSDKTLENMNDAIKNIEEISGSAESVLMGSSQVPRPRNLFGENERQETRNNVRGIGYISEPHIFFTVHLPMPSPISMSLCISIIFLLVVDIVTHFIPFYYLILFCILVVFITFLIGIPRKFNINFNIF